MPPITNLPASNNYEGMFVNALNFRPLDFNFYQKRAPINSNSELVTNQLKGAFNFSNPDQYVSSAGVNLTPADDLNEMTIECWVKADENYATNHGIIWQYSDGTNTISIFDPCWLTLTVNNAKIMLFKEIMDGLWHHIAIVCKQNCLIEVYFDSSLVNYQAINYTSMANGGTLSLATYSAGYDLGGNAGGSSPGDFIGLIGQVRVWDTAQNINEIIYNAGRYLSPVEMSGLGLYWSNEFDVSTNLINDSSKAKKTSNLGLFINPGEVPDIWNTADYYGALLDTNHVQPHPVNMTGNAILSDSDSQHFMKGLNTETGFTSFTMELWIKADSTNNNNNEIFGITKNTSVYNFRLRNPHALTMYFPDCNADTITTQCSIMDGKWHHLAVSWASGTSVSLYVDSIRIYHLDNALGYTFPVAETITEYKLYLGGGNSSNRMLGQISEFRFFTSIRSQEEILSDASYRAYQPIEHLLVYWPFSRSFIERRRIEDFSGNGLNGSIHGNPQWTDTQLFGFLANGFMVAPQLSGSEDTGHPVPSWQYGQMDLTFLTSGGTLLSGAMEGFPNVSMDQLEQAFYDAQTHGYFDPVIFPNIYFANTIDRTDSQASMSLIDFEEFVFYWISDKRINFYRNFSDEMVYEFIPVPKGYGPTLLLLLDTRISSYYGDIGGGQVVRTFSLMPGESSYVSIDTYKKTSQQEEDTSSIFDSSNQSARESFQNSLNLEGGVDMDLSAALDFHASAETKLRWIEGNLDVKGSIGASIQAKIQTHLQVVSNSMSSHANERSTERNVEVNTNYTVTSESGSNTAITREFKNINNSKTLNIIFKQMNQQFVVQHILTNIRVGYFDPAPGSYRTVQLSQLDDLLQEVLVDNPATLLEFKTKIIMAAYAAASMGITSYEVGDFIKQRDVVSGAMSDISIRTDGTPEVSAHMEYFINPAALSTFDIAGDAIQTPGVVLSTDYFTMKTDNVIADLELGEYLGLDTYAESLRTQAVIREEAVNGGIEVANRRTATALGILNTAKQAGMNAQELAELYKELFLVKPDVLTEIYKPESTSTSAAS
jgi:hypothetical protein